MKKILNSEKAIQILYSSPIIKKRRPWLERELRELDWIDCKEIDILTKPTYFMVRIITWNYTAVIRIIRKDFYKYNLRLKNNFGELGYAKSLREVCKVLSQNT